jgi:mannan endo-1,4-beta-mannosidase
VPESPVNSALNQTATASNIHSANYGPEKAVDGDPNTRWATSESPAWVEVDFGEIIMVNGTRFTDYGDRIRAYEIQYYDGEWKTAFSGGDPGAEQTDWFPAVMGSTIRLQTMESTANPSIWEFEIFTVSAEMTSMDRAGDAVALEWPNTPGVSYSVQSSTNLASDLFSTILESGIPSVEESSRIVIDLPADNATHYWIAVED